MTNNYPLVSVLIPTFNRPDYFRLALESALSQTYNNIEIIIGDDSTNDETKNLVYQQYLGKYSNIAYYHNESNLGQFDNDLKLIEMAHGEYINFLMDDDLFEASKIEKMMAYFLQDTNEELSLVTSHRGIINENGNITGVYGNTDKLFSHSAIVDSVKLCDFMLMNNINCIGEPTTVLFRKTKLIEPFGTLNGRKAWCNVDLASWYNLLSSGRAVFINEILSCFRIHTGQQLGSTKMRILGATDYVHEVLTSGNKGFLQDCKDLRSAMQTCNAHCNKVKAEISQIGVAEKYKAEYVEFEKYYNMLQHAIKSLDVLFIQTGELTFLNQIIQDAEKNLQNKSYKAFYLNLLQIFEQNAQELESQQAVFLQWITQCKNVTADEPTGYESMVTHLLALVLEKSLRNHLQQKVLERLLPLHQDLAKNHSFALINERVAQYFIEQGKRLIQGGQEAAGQEYVEAGIRLSPTAQLLERAMQVEDESGRKRRKNQVAAVVIPVYRRHMAEYERISLTQCRRVLQPYTKIFIAPDSLRMDEYMQCIPDALVMTFPEEWFRSIVTYNRLLMSAAFYEKFRAYTYILIHQLDAFVFADKLQYFCDLGYDYIGAPWVAGRHVALGGAADAAVACYVGNGGLSLRHVGHSTGMLAALGDRVRTWPGNEDIFWSYCGEVYREKFNVAPVNIAEQFAFEEKPRESYAKLGVLPFGCHAWEKYDIEFMREVFVKYGYRIG